MKRIVESIICAAAVAALFAGTALSHETLIKVKNPNPKKSEKVDAEIMVGHVVIDASEEVTEPETVDVGIIKDGAVYPAVVVADHDAELSRIEVDYPVEGTAWLVMHAKPKLVSQTPEGLKEGDKTTLTDTEVLFTDKYEKFIKVLLNADVADMSYSQPLGHVLEIVPENNPATLKVGDDLKIKVLLNGKPVIMPVFASYDGFTERENSYAFYIAPEDPDDIHVRIHQPGFWVVLVTAKTPGGKDIKTHHLTAALEFEVK